MTDWTAGYVADVGYTFGYYTELNPLRVKLAFLNAGLSWPNTGAACELGFGQGVSVNIHAAASTIHWHGTDFNPAQAGFAQELASHSGADAKLFDDAFTDFVSRKDLPEFDYIGLHGIWSWISDENRAVIVDFIRSKLKVGGVLYISYNTQPGWAAMVPMRDLLTEHSETMGAQGQGIIPRINGAIDFAEKLFATNPAYLKVNPVINDRFKSLKTHDRNYLAHEYFNRDWHPMPFSRMADWLKPAKISFACSASYIDHIDAVNLTEEQQTFLREIPDPMFRESVRDFMINQQFRRDYWVKGARTLNNLERIEALRALKVILTTHRDDISLKVNGALGEAAMSEAVYNPILDLMADHKAKTIEQIEQAVSAKGVNFGQLIQATMILTGMGHLAVMQEDGAISKAKKQTDKLNAHLMEKARYTKGIDYLASPVTAGGVAVGRFQQLFLLALSRGKKQPAEWVQFAWQTLSLQKQKIVKDGRTLDTDEDNVAELTAQANTFAQKQLPILKALQIVS